MAEMNVSFWLRKSEPNPKGEVPIMCRISYSRDDRDGFSTGYYVDENFWDTKERRATVLCPNQDEINVGLLKIRSKVERAEAQLLALDEEVTAQTVKLKYQNKTKSKRKRLLDTIKEHNTWYEANIGILKGHSDKTLLRYSKLLEVMQEFLRTQYRRSDIHLDELSYAFAEKFVQYLLHEKHLELTTVCFNFWRKLNKVLSRSMKLRECPPYPFGDYSVTPPDTTKPKLTPDEIAAIINKRFTIERMERVRERAVCSIFTGMSYSDLEQFHLDWIEIGMDGNKHIRYNRGKSGKEAILPIYPWVQEILNKYAPAADQRGGKIFPSISNQRFNSYLTELADACGIKIKLTSHVFRHTFGQIQSDAGVTDEVVAKMMGHADTKTTKKNYVRTSASRVMLEKDRLQDAIKPHLKVAQ